MFTVYDFTGRRFVITADRGLARRLATRIGGTISTVVFGTVVSVTITD